MESFVTNSATYLNFEHSFYFLLILLCPVIFILEYMFGRNSFYSLQKLRKFIDAHLIKYIVSKGESRRKAYFRLGSLFLFIIFTAFALANPRWDFTEIESYKPNTNIIFLLDVSNSMLAEDEKPNRLERAKQEISDVMTNVENANFALIAFAHQAHVISPLTDDKDNLNYLLPSVTTDIVSIQGSNVAAAIIAAKQLIKTSESGVNYIVVLSDGGFESLSDVPRLDKQTEIITYGFGTPEGAPIPDADGSFIKNNNNKIVLSKLEQRNMENLAGSKGLYVKATYLDDDVSQLKSKILSKMIVEKSKYSNMRVWNDRFYIFVILAMLVLAPFFARGARFPVIIVMLSLPFSSNAEEIKNKLSTDMLNFKNIEYNFFNNQNEQAEIDFHKRKYSTAAKKFTSDYNKGVSYYRAKKYDKAEENFAKDKSVTSTYNLGNAQLRQFKLEDAIRSYENVLKREPAHQDAKFNLEIAKKMLKRQQEEQKKNEQDRKNDKDKQNDKQNENKKDDQNNSQNDNGNDGQQSKDGDENKQSEKNQDGQEEKTKIDFGKSKEGDKQQDKSLIQKQNELQMKADKIFKKINSDPEKLMKNRFKIEEEKLGDKQLKEDIKPW